MNKAGAWLFVAWIVAVIATGASLYLSEIMHFVPCSLCWFQRIFMYPLVIMLGIAFYRQQSDVVPYAAALAIVGGCISAYHTVLQKVPKDTSIAACGPVSCYEDYLNWFGWLTIPRCHSRSSAFTSGITSGTAGSIR